MLDYGAIVCWVKATQKGAVRLLSSTQRLACLSVTGAMRTTQTASIEALLNLLPLQIFVEYATRLTRHRLLRSQPPLITGHGEEHLRIRLCKVLWRDGKDLCFNQPRSICHSVLIVLITECTQDILSSNLRGKRLASLQSKNKKKDRVAKEGVSTTIEGPEPSVNCPSAMQKGL